MTDAEMPSLLLPVIILVMTVVMNTVKVPLTCNKLPSVLPLKCANDSILIKILYLT